MPAISFSGEPKRGEFWKLILSGEKKQTVRAPRCHPIKRGDKLTLYWKQRQPLYLIDKGGERNYPMKLNKPIHLIGYAICTGVERVKKRDFLFNQDFAKADGFTDELELQEWFGRENDSFDYEVIHFELINSMRPIQQVLAYVSTQNLTRGVEK